MVPYLKQWCCLLRRFTIANHMISSKIKVCCRAVQDTCFIKYSHTAYISSAGCSDKHTYIEFYRLNRCTKDHIENGRFDASSGRHVSIQFHRLERKTAGKEEEGRNRQLVQNCAQVSHVSHLYIKFALPVNALPSRRTEFLEAPSSGQRWSGDQAYGKENAFHIIVAFRRAVPEEFTAIYRKLDGGNGEEESSHLTDDEDFIQQIEKRREEK